MSYVSYSVDGIRHVGISAGDRVIPLAGISHIGAGTGQKQLREAVTQSEDSVALAAVTLLPASPVPQRILCVGLNYRGHIEETGRETPTYPVLFPKFASNLIAAGDDILLPSESSQPDFEGELAVIIGTAGRRISETDALSHVLGYTIANDVTMRDFQYKTHQWLQGKAWDNSTPLGPAIFTPDEVDISAAGIRTVLNGVTVQESDLGKLIFSIPRLIAEISTFTRLEAGDVILTGTPEGVGFRRDPQLFLKSGDKISVEIDGIGRLDSGVRAD